jgi:hypothetical protein
LSINRWIVVAAIGLSFPAVAQQPPPQPPAGGPTGGPQLSDQWEKLPRLQLEATFAGPLRDTIIQRFRDPGDGMVCYVYLPISAPIAPSQSGFMQYGPNSIGSISCVAGGASAPAAAAKQPARPPAPKNTPAPAPKQ